MHEVLKLRPKTQHNESGKLISIELPGFKVLKSIAAPMGSRYAQVFAIAATIDLTGKQ
ncbi:hypothetical protein [Paraflavitalea speifideaquila]|uniref:hypothetical protein n=1 Tax=Paraflavitalea speifideaquila TaxID=3076558 RepID=UPI0028E52AB6|nr:hypothetical protein [Paraflavitalea speifideiaquila]